MPVKKWFTSVKKPTVTVETKKMSNAVMSNWDCCSTNWDWTMKRKCCGKIILFLLLIINTVLLISMFCRQSNIEAMRVGGYDNYKMLKQVFSSEGFKNQQKQQIQQAIQLYQVSPDAATAKDATATTPIQ